MPEFRVFEWDETKALSNLAKHGVAFPEAIRVFRDSKLIELGASRPEDRQVRMKALGAIQGPLFTVVYTNRAGVTRIISARRCNPTERRLYGAPDD